MLLSALPHWEQTVSDPASEPVPGSYFVDMHPSYVLEKNVPYNVSPEFSVCRHLKIVT